MKTHMGETTEKEENSNVNDNYRGGFFGQQGILDSDRSSLFRVGRNLLFIQVVYVDKGKESCLF